MAALAFPHPSSLFFLLVGKLTFPKLILQLQLDSWFSYAISNTHTIFSESSHVKFTVICQHAQGNLPAIGCEAHEVTTTLSS